MKALIVYDTFFSNTEQIARAIGNTLSTLTPQVNVQTRRVQEIVPEHLRDLDLLVVGSPTRAFKPTAPITNLLKAMPRQGLRGVKAVAFDTRIPLEGINSVIGRFFIRRFGYAAEKIARALQKHGAELVVPAAGFAVRASEGPLQEGELQRAAHWLEVIIQKIAAGDRE
ncbi:MAG TPA: nitric oxide synthase [bacterium]|nr:nitric oxide synthase [bacterium]HPN45579.1 nitric oxide synthase [bacterium]